VLCAQLLGETTIVAVRGQFETLFRRYGVPSAIQCDNGEPFINVQSRGGLTRLSAWWVSLGITIVRSRPGCPQDNGAHERMHRDIRDQVERFPQADRFHEQRALDRWRQEFNHVRPHEALHGKTPAELYRPGRRRSLHPMAWPYPPSWTIKRATGPLGCIYFQGERLAVGRPFVGHRIGIEPLSERSIRLWLHDIALGECEVTPPIAIIDAACTTFLKRRNRKVA
jgi:hypothetical protein